MSKLSFRSRQLDVNKPINIYKYEDFNKISDFKHGPRSVAPIPSGMEKEEETELHLQQAIQSQKVTVKGVVIPTPSVEFSEDYDILYKGNFSLPKQLIHVQPFDVEDNHPEYDCDTEDELWLSQINEKWKSQTLNFSINSTIFEQIMDNFEKASTHQMITFDEAKLLIKENDLILKTIFEYWHRKRFFKGSNLVPLILTEKKGGISSGISTPLSNFPTLLNENYNISPITMIIPPLFTSTTSETIGATNPYIAFRRRAEKMQTRKNRKNDEYSYEKMLKLRRDLLKAIKLFELLEKREMLKSQLVKIINKTFDSRYQSEDFTGELLSQCTKNVWKLSDESNGGSSKLLKFNSSMNDNGFVTSKPLLSPFKDQFEWGPETKKRLSSPSSQENSRLNYKLLKRQKLETQSGSRYYVTNNNEFRGVVGCVKHDESLVHYKSREANTAKRKILLSKMLSSPEKLTQHDGQQLQPPPPTTLKKRTSFRNLPDDFYYSGIGNLNTGSGTTSSAFTYCSATTAGATPATASRKRQHKESKNKFFNNKKTSSAVFKQFDHPEYYYYDVVREDVESGGGGIVKGFSSPSFSSTTIKNNNRRSRKKLPGNQRNPTITSTANIPLLVNSYNTPFGPPLRLRDPSSYFNYNNDKPFLLNPNPLTAAYRKYVFLKKLLRLLKSRYYNRQNLQQVSLAAGGSHEDLPIHHTFKFSLKRFLNSLNLNFKNQWSISNDQNDYLPSLQLPSFGIRTATYQLPISLENWRIFLNDEDRSKEERFQSHVKILPVVKRSRLGWTIERSHRHGISNNSKDKNGLEINQKILPCNVSSSQQSNKFLSFLNYPQTVIVNNNADQKLSRITPFSLKETLTKIRKGIKYPSINSHTSLNCLIYNEKSINNALPCLSSLFRDIPYTNTYHHKAEATTTTFYTTSNDNSTTINKTLLRKTLNSNSSIVYTNTNCHNQKENIRRYNQQYNYDNNNNLNTEQLLQQQSSNIPTRIHQQLYQAVPPDDENYTPPSSFSLNSPSLSKLINRGGVVVNLNNNNNNNKDEDNNAPIKNLYLYNSAAAAKSHANNKHLGLPGSGSGGGPSFLPTSLQDLLLRNSGASAPSASPLVVVEEGGGTNMTENASITSNKHLGGGINTSSQQYLLFRPHHQKTTKNTAATADPTYVNQHLHPVVSSLNYLPTSEGTTTSSLRYHHGSRVPTSSSLISLPDTFVSNYQKYNLSSISAVNNATTLKTNQAAVTANPLLTQYLSSYSNNVNNNNNNTTTFDQQQQAIAAAAALQLQLNNLSNLLLNNQQNNTLMNFKSGNNNASSKFIIPLTNNNTTPTTAVASYVNKRFAGTTTNKNDNKSFTSTTTISTNSQGFSVAARTPYNGPAPTNNNLNQNLFYQQPYLIRDSTTGDYVIKSSLLTSYNPTNKLLIPPTLETYSAALSNSNNTNINTAYNKTNVFQAITTSFNNNLPPNNNSSSLGLTSLASYILNFTSNNTGGGSGGGVNNNPTNNNNNNNPKLFQIGNSSIFKLATSSINTQTCIHNNSLICHQSGISTNHHQNLGGGQNQNPSKINLPFYKVVSLVNSDINNNNQLLGILNHPQTLPPSSKSSYSDNPQNNPNPPNNVNKFRTLSLLIPSGSSFLINSSIGGTNNTIFTLANSNTSKLLTACEGDSGGNNYYPSKTFSTSSILNGLLDQGGGGSSISLEGIKSSVFETRSDAFFNEKNTLDKGGGNGGGGTTLSQNNTTISMPSSSYHPPTSTSTSSSTTITTTPSFSPTIVNLFAIT